MSTKFIAQYLFLSNLQSDAGSGSDQSDSSSTPLNKSTTPTQTSPAVEITQDKSSESSSRKSSLSRKDSKSDKRKSSMKEKNAGGAPEKSVKSKSPDKTQAVIEPVEKTGSTEDSSEKKQSVIKETANNQGKLMAWCLSNSIEWEFFNNAFVEQDYKYIYIKIGQYHSFIKKFSFEC